MGVTPSPWHLQAVWMSYSHLTREVNKLSGRWMKYGSAHYNKGKVFVSGIIFYILYSVNGVQKNEVRIKLQKT